MIENTTAKKSNFLQELIQSFNPNFYCSIVPQAFGRSLRYLILLAFFAAVALSVRYTVDLKIQMFGAMKWARANIPQILSGIPEITIENGQVFCAAQQPFVKIWNVGKDQAVFIIDTTGEITSLEGYDNALFFTKNKLIFKSTEREGMAKIQEYDLSKVAYFKLQPGEGAKGEIVNIAFDKEKIYQLTYKKLARWLRVVRWMAFPIILISLFSYYIFAKMVQLFVFSPLSLLVGKFAQSGINYSKLLNIGAYALTPPTSFAVLFTIIKWNIRNFWLLYIGVYMTFLIIAVLKCKKSLMVQG